MPRSKKQEQNQNTQNQTNTEMFTRQDNNVVNDIQDNNVIDKQEKNQTDNIYEQIITRIAKDTRIRLYRILGSKPIGNNEYVMNHIVFYLKFRYNVKEPQIQEKIETIKNATIYSISEEIENVVRENVYKSIPPIGISQSILLDILAECIYSKFFADNNGN